MSDNPNAEIIAIGTELLLGEITDTNSVFMARALRDVGVNVFYMTTVGDNLTRIADAIDLALDRAEIVITCGGLGPTVDDMTRQGIAQATKRDLVFHQSLYDVIAERFRGFGVKMTENNRQQAYLPSDAIVIENPVGTAPSFIVQTERGVVISLPGVPREMKYLMNSSVIPYLLEQYNLGIIIARTLKTAGIGESSLDDMIGRDILSQSNPTVGLAAHHGSVDVRITAKAETKDIALKMLNAMQNNVMDKIAKFVYGTDADTLENVVLDFLKHHSLKIFLVEVGLLGAISEKLGSHPENITVEKFESPEDIYKKFNIDDTLDLKDSAIYLAGKLYADESVDAGLVLISLPNIEESADVDQGSAIALVTEDITRHRVYGFGAKSNLAKDWMPRWGLSTLWRVLKEKYDDLV